MLLARRDSNQAGLYMRSISLGRRSERGRLKWGSHLGEEVRHLSRHEEAVYDLEKGFVLNFGLGQQESGGLALLPAFLVEEPKAISIRRRGLTSIVLQHVDDKL